MTWLAYLALSVAAVALWGAVSEIRHGISRDHRVRCLDVRLRNLERHLEGTKPDWRVRPE